MASERVGVLGVLFSVVNLPRALATIRGWVAQGQPNYVCVTPAHGVMDARRDPELLMVLNRSGLTTPDGMSIVWLLRLLGHRGVERVYGPELMLALCGESVDAGWRHFFYGGGDGVGERLAARLGELFPGLRIAGTFTPPFRQLTVEEDEEVVSLIRASGADVVWVGLGTPKQERWMADHVGRVGAPVLVGVGAAFDFLSGIKPQAPGWMGRSGLEWLFRLATEPRRLWRRYAEYPRFALLVAAQLLGLRRFEPPES